MSFVKIGVGSAEQFTTVSKFLVLSKLIMMWESSQTCCTHSEAGVTVRTEQVESLGTSKHGYRKENLPLKNLALNLILLLKV